MIVRMLYYWASSRDRTVRAILPPKPPKDPPYCVVIRKEHDLTVLVSLKMQETREKM